MLRLTYRLRRADGAAIPRDIATGNTAFDDRASAEGHIATGDDVTPDGDTGCNGDITVNCEEYVVYLGTVGQENVSINGYLIINSQDKQSTREPFHCVSATYCGTCGSIGDGGCRGRIDQGAVTFDVVYRDASVVR